MKKPFSFLSRQTDEVVAAEQPEEKRDMLLIALMMERDMEGKLWAFRSDTGSPHLTPPSKERYDLMVQRIIDDAEEIERLKGEIEFHKNMKPYEELRSTT